MLVETERKRRSVVKMGRKIGLWERSGAGVERKREVHVSSLIRNALPQVLHTLV